MDFIARLEGGSMTRGYVPDAMNSRSGVTIATGFDLGQRHMADLQGLHLPDALCQRLAPYLGLTGSSALATLKATPLEISRDEALAIDSAYKAPFIQQLQEQYSRTANAAFADLPAACQTVIASVAFQYGHLAKRTPKFWGQVVARDWAAAVDNLRHFGDRYAGRRRQEADLLASVL